MPKTGLVQLRWLCVLCAVSAPLVLPLGCGSDSGASPSTPHETSAGAGAGGDDPVDDDDDVPMSDLVVCGDGVRAPSEQCDDGNLADGDGCSWRCREEIGVCGNGTREPDEACDDGNVRDGDGCDAYCQPEVQEASCGDGTTAEEEECDDANLSAGDGCDELCREEACGNQRLDAGEECDPPLGNRCSSSCLFESPHCGDGHVQADEFETCDDANAEPADGCDECRITCGDGRVEGALGEHCEPEHSPGSCGTDCQWLPVCGDGAVQTEVGEECDPDNGVTCVGCQVIPPEPPVCDDVDGGGEGAGGASEDDADEECPPPACVPLGPGELLANGEFGNGTSGWLPHTPLVTLEAVSENVPDPAALSVAFGSAPTRSVSGAYQCLPIKAGASYELNLEYLIPEDTDQGVLANVTALLYRGAGCQGVWVPPAGNGPTGSGRGAFRAYHYLIDTSPLGDESSVAEASLLLRLNVNQPANVTGSRVVYDNVSLTEVGSVCGNCVIDAGETCDDGNQTAGDGCGSLCDAELCGNAILQGAEACDDGNNSFGEGDTCTPACAFPNACNECVLTACPRALNGPALLDDCWNLTGEAQQGPAAGAPRSLLCARLLACAERTACAQIERVTEGVPGAFFENCYCGSAGDRCFDSSGLANGSCKAEVEAALESSEPLTVFERMGGSDPGYPIFASVNGLLSCESDACPSECVVPSLCGDGSIQDRNFDFVFQIGRDEIPCRDDFTHTGRGCSFEECDDTNLVPGDGCDEYCFIEACGNYVVQAGEECDDGNLESGDGCNVECQAEFSCGDSVVTLPFEECDPPDSGALCSVEEYEADPSGCGCDSQCAHTVCGNGTLQVPAEECDPPDGVICDESCQLLGGGPCEDCINAIPDVGDFNREFCNTDPLCFAVKQCALASIDRDGDQTLDGTCYLPIPAECYCGIGSDLDACELPDFEPVGPCASEMLAGSGDDAPDNTVVLERFYSFDHASGRAMAIVEEARIACAEACDLL